MADYASELIQIDAAITAILTGAQSYSIAGRSMSRADLSALYDRKRWLEAQVARTIRGGGIRVRLGTPTG
jgi:hypothetical protein